MRAFFLLVSKECRDILFSRRTLLFLLVVCFLTGYSFYSAVTLYGRASVHALKDPLYATGFEPVPGVFVPAWGGLFVLLSLFLPFIVIPRITAEKERNTFVILSQLLFTFREILSAKVLSALALVLVVFFLMIPTVILWVTAGGHIAWGELLLLNLGYLLYSLFVIGVSICAAALLSNTAGASIVSILVITASWVIDFGKDMNISPAILALSRFTTTRMLDFFEKGIFSSAAMLEFIVLFLLFSLLSLYFLEVNRKPGWLIAALLIVCALGTVAAGWSVNIDVSESRRNSFPESISAALQRLPPVEIDVYLRRTDSRFKDYEDNFLNRLRLVKRDVRVHFMHGTALEKDYGRFVYRINGREAETFSNSEEEIFPLMFELAGIDAPANSQNISFPGYPLVFPENRLPVIWLVYCLIFPLILSAVAVFRTFRITGRDIS